MDSLWSTLRYSMLDLHVVQGCYNLSALGLFAWIELEDCLVVTTRSVQSHGCGRFKITLSEICWDVIKGRIAQATVWITPEISLKRTFSLCLLHCYWCSFRGNMIRLYVMILTPFFFFKSRLFWSSYLSRSTIIAVKRSITRGKELSAKMWNIDCARWLFFFLLLLFSFGLSLWRDHIDAVVCVHGFNCAHLPALLPLPPPPSLLLPPPPTSS